jgi:signal transduction histidine kinase
MDMTDKQAQQTQKQLVNLEHRVSILTRLAEMSAVINSTMRLKPLLEHIMAAAAEITNAEAASVLLWEKKSNTLRFAATTSGVSNSLLGKVVPLEGSIAGTILKERRVVVVNDVRNEPRHYDKIDEDIRFQTRSVLGVPMWSKDRVIGVIEAVNRRKLPWTEDDVQYLTILAAQAAVAIDGTQLVARLESANAELSKVDQLKNEFIALASHELRTPLGVILGYASFLQESRDPEVNDHASKVVASALQLRRIIEDLTSLRYLQQNESELVRETITLDKLVSDVLADVQGVADAKHHTVRANVTPGIRLFVDPIRFNMALTNIVMNAVRFTPDGGEIDIRGDFAPQRQALLLVRDNGIGIAAEDIGRIFDKFYQVEDHMTRHHGGLGIGLSLSKALIEAHGGRISAESAGLNKGATFSITLPLADGK